MVKDKDLLPEEKVEASEPESDALTPQEPSSTLQNSPKFRFYCPSCTNTAFYTNNKESFSSRPCMVCGKEVFYDEHNFIEV